MYVFLSLSLSLSLSLCIHVMGYKNKNKTKKNIPVIWAPSADLESHSGGGGVGREGWDEVG
jgi:hypothetical protein